jgi:hypothetical protein
MKTSYIHFRRGVKIETVLISIQLTRTSHIVHEIYINN